MATVSDTYAKYFVPKASPEEVLRELASWVEKSGEHYWGSIISFLLNIPGFLEQIDGWREVCMSINQKLKNQQTQPNEIMELLKGLLILSDLPNQEAIKNISHNVLSSLRRDGTLFHHLYQAWSVGDTKAVAWCLSAIFEPGPENSPSSPPPWWGNSSSGWEIYNQILNQPQSYPEVVKEFASICIWRVKRFRENFDKLMTTLEAFPGELTKAAFEEITKDPNKVLDFFVPEGVVKHFSSLKEIVGKESLRSLIQRLTKEQGLVGKIIEGKFDPQLDELYLWVLESCPEEDKSKYLEYLVNKLKELKKENWLESFKGLGSLILLVSKLVEQEFPTNFDHQFHDALLEHAKMTFEEQDGRFTEEWISAWKKLPCAIEEGQRKVWGKNLRDEFLKNADEKNSSFFLTLYGESLLSFGDLEERGEEIIRKIFKAFLERCDKIELEWMEKVIERIWGKVDKEIKKDFIQRLNEKVLEEGVSEEAKEILKRILKQIVEISNIFPK